MLARQMLLSASCLGLVLAIASPAAALDIYEPDSNYALAPNMAVSRATGGTETKAKVSASGAVLLSVRPQFANVVMTGDGAGRVRSEVYLNLQRVLTFDGDDGTRAHAVADVLNRLNREGRLRADQITPNRRGNQYVVVVGREPIITVDSNAVSPQGLPPATLVLRWVNKMRVAMGGLPFERTASRGGALLGSMTGRASWYGPGFHGRRSASGERFDQNMMTAAHKSLPFGTVLMVTNLRNQRSCLVRINDRGPYIPGRELDLSYAAARSIGVSGVSDVRIEVFKQ
jgi:rare lipoprotein A